MRVRMWRFAHFILLWTWWHNIRWRRNRWTLLGNLSASQVFAFSVTFPYSGVNTRACIRQTDTASNPVISKTWVESDIGCLRPLSLNLRRYWCGSSIARVPSWMWPDRQSERVSWPGMSRYPWSWRIDSLNCQRLYNSQFQHLYITVMIVNRQPLTCCHFLLSYSSWNTSSPSTIWRLKCVYKLWRIPLSRDSRCWITLSLRNLSPQTAGRFVISWIWFDAFCFNSSRRRCSPAVTRDVGFRERYLLSNCRLLHTFGRGACKRSLILRNLGKHALLFRAHLMVACTAAWKSSEVLRLCFVTCWENNMSVALAYMLHHASI